MTDKSTHPATTLIQKFDVLVATWFYTGLIPSLLKNKEMAGTYGSIAALPLCWLLIHEHNLGRTPDWTYYIAIALVMLFGIVTIEGAEKALGPRKDHKGRIRTRDQNQIVIDEVLGMLLACMPMLIRPDLSWWWYLVALGLFRLFDITKPGLIRTLDEVPNEVGVMLDDLAAGLAAAVVIGVLVFFIG